MGEGRESQSRQTLTFYKGCDKHNTVYELSVEVQLDGYSRQRGYNENAKCSLTTCSVYGFYRTQSKHTFEGVEDSRDKLFRGFKLE